MTVLHTAPGAPRIGRPREHRSLAAVLAAVGIPMFMVTLDNLVVTTVLPVIKTNLGASLTDLQWFVNAYTLSFAAPSKTDAERLLLVSPELSEVLTAIIFRVREGKAGLPLVSAYDVFEQTWSPPMPFLFQRRFGT